MGRLLARLTRVPFCHEDRSRPTNFAFDFPFFHVETGKLIKGNPMCSSKQQRNSIGLILVLLLCRAAFAEQVIPYDSNLAAGTVCTVEIAKLRPTQFAVGEWEVEKRAEKIAQLKPKKLEEYLGNHQPVVVIGPQGIPYVIDGHHLCCALLKAGIRTTVEVKVEANLHRLDTALFWDVMKDSGWVYLYDEKGRGPFAPDRLPKSVAELADDPYRSLAWAVCERGGWDKSNSSFAEFRWAEFFRSRVRIDDRSGFGKAVAEALDLCHRPEAKALPGYIPPEK